MKIVSSHKRGQHHHQLARSYPPLAAPDAKHLLYEQILLQGFLLPCFDVLVVRLSAVTKQ